MALCVIPIGIRMMPLCFAMVILDLTETMVSLECNFAHLSAMHLLKYLACR